MAYSNFKTFEDIEKSLGLEIKSERSLIQFSEVNPSDHLTTTLEYSIPLAVAIATEKGLSELIIAPILSIQQKVFPHRKDPYKIRAS